MEKIIILDEQEPLVQSADRTKAVKAWSWGNLYLPKPGKWVSHYKESQALISESIHVLWCFI